MKLLFPVLITVMAAGSLTAADNPLPAGRAGDLRKVTFILPFKDALAKAKEQQRLLFVKPIYGGVDAAGAKDYRCGSW